MNKEKCFLKSYGFRMPFAALFFILYSLFFATAHAAPAVTTRGTNSQTRQTVGRVSAVRAPIVVQQQEVIKEEETVVEPIVEAAVVDNKSEQFETAMAATNSGTDKSTTALAEMIQRQRAALDSADATATATQRAAANLQSGKNACDTALRDCVAKDCGMDFSKCGDEGDTAFGNRLNTCRRSTECNGEEFNLFSIEIKADKEFNRQISSYDEAIDCGNRYNTCIIGVCGTDLNNCLSRATETNAISKCTSIANECKTADNGLPGRVQQVFGTLRGQAEVQIAKDEEKLRNLRVAMSDSCKSLGANFDERTLDCVFTANFFAGDQSTLFASKKLYAGSTFDCTPNWFGVDITTYRENAARLTREATGASSAMLGAGLGIAAGAISSGAIGRAMDTQKAEKAVKAAEDARGESGSVSSGTETEKTDNKATGLLGTVGGALGIGTGGAAPLTTGNDQKTGSEDVLSSYGTPNESELNVSSGDYGNTPFMVAVTTTEPAITVDAVKELIARGGDVNKTNNNGGQYQNSELNARRWLNI